MLDDVINEAYVEKHARPGEEWEAARSRLIGELFERFTRIPDCPTCLLETGSIVLAEEHHARGGCTNLYELDVWPAEALSAKRLAAHHGHRLRHLDAQRFIARQKVARYLDNIDAKEHPLHAMMASMAAKGFMSACEHLGVFEHPELMQLQHAVLVRLERAQEAFFQLVKDGSPDAVPSPESNPRATGR